jgi:hypothetical protein
MSMIEGPAASISSRCQTTGERVNNRRDLFRVIGVGIADESIDPTTTLFVKQVLVRLSSPSAQSLRVIPNINVLPFNRFVTSNSLTQRS